MNIIFFANDNFAIPTLKFLLSSNYSIICGVTDEGKEKGRGLKYTENDISKIYKNNNIPIVNTKNLNKSIDTIKSLDPDLFIVISYKILKPEIFNIPKHGTVNLHPSLLPQYRGAAPMQRALINGDKSIGLTTFFINDKIDSGKIICQKSYKINDKITYSELYDTIASRGANIIKDTINKIKQTNFQASHQINKNRSYAFKIKKSEYTISFNDTSLNIHNKIRGLTKPGCYCFYNNKRIKIYDTYYDNMNIPDFKIGQFKLINSSIHIQCEKGVLICNKIQIEGKKIINSLNFYKNINNNNYFFKNATKI